MKILSLFFFLISVVFSQNKDPIVLIHGFFGWGNEELGDYKYWGGKKDIQRMLESHGYRVINVSVGPISSNWDRAIEVYYQLKGVKDYYFLSNSKKYGLIQKPHDKKYEG